MSATLRFDNIGKVFPGVRALDGVSFDVNAGQVHGLMGENGAGKSTLLKILGGEYQPDSGQILIDGNDVRFASAAASISAGIAVIHQELQYVPDLTVAENLLLGQLPNALGWVNKREAKRFVRERLAAMGVDLDPNAKLGKLSIAQRQMVEICKALVRNARVVPVADLHAKEHADGDDQEFDADAEPILLFEARAKTSQHQRASSSKSLGSDGFGQSPFGSG